MIDFIDRVSSGKKIIKYENGTTETVTIENAEDATVEGTPINRENMMAIQGFVGMTTEKKDGGVLQTNSNGDKLFTIKNTDDSITQTFTGKNGKVITKTIKKENGKIVEVIS